MRLINAETLALENFNNEEKLPGFAILSHRWVDEEEVLFRDIVGFDNELAELIVRAFPTAHVDLPKRSRPELKGWDKIEQCCAQALEDNLKYVWVDTCCINKDSSAELSEAINSMFRWYARADICYAYLLDVSLGSGWEKKFIKSSWFERAWTLQELLAPKSVVFYDRDWRKLGLRSSLSEDIAEASGIHLEVFTAEKLSLDDWSIAQRMSWASRRKATRTEDLAYSLLGIFDVNLPLLYGEGMKAFQRLQEAIIQQTDDHTIFAWSASETTDRCTGIFAPSAAAFKDDSDLIQQNFEYSTPFSLTNLGLAINLPLQAWSPNIVWAGLNCTRNQLDQVGIFLVKDAHPSGVLVKSSIGRKLCNEMRRRDLRCRHQDVTIAIRLNPTQVQRLHHNRLDDIPGISIERIKVYGNLARSQDLVSETLNSSTIISADPQIQYHKTVRGAGIYGTRTSWRIDVEPQASTPCYGSICVVEFPHGRTAVRALMLGIDLELKPFCILAEPYHTAYQEWGSSSKDRDHLTDHGRSLFPKTFRQCSGLEDDGWLPPSDGLQSHPSAMQRGLWALKGDGNPRSKFLLHLTNVDVDVRFNEIRNGAGRRYWHFVMRRTSDTLTRSDREESLHSLNVSLEGETDYERLEQGVLTPSTSQDSVDTI